jgi:hypothetical protein
VFLILPSIIPDSTLIVKENPKIIFVVTHIHILYRPSRQIARVILNKSFGKIANWNRIKCIGALPPELFPENADFFIVLSLANTTTYDYWTNRIEYDNGKYAGQVDGNRRRYGYETEHG